MHATRAEVRGDSVTSKLLETSVSWSTVLICSTCYFPMSISTGDDSTPSAPSITIWSPLATSRLFRTLKVSAQKSCPHTLQRQTPWNTQSMRQGWGGGGRESKLKQAWRILFETGQRRVGWLWSRRLLGCWTVSLQIHTQHFSVQPDRRLKNNHHHSTKKTYEDGKWAKTENFDKLKKGESSAPPHRSL